MKDIVRQIRKYRPERVVTADPYRRYLWHRDHRITGRVTLDAIFPFARDRLSFPELLQEGLEPYKVLSIILAMTDQVTHYVDIDSSINQKVRALLEHRSQIGDPETLDNRIRKRAKTSARGKPYSYAEGFRWIRLSR